ncbi:hypothetical protein ppKF707_3158 [Metapseudomonas furukawaii]|nr:hypothetical protein ppKF707_3158 [Pseudomonas furukawaii]
MRQVAAGAPGGRWERSGRGGAVHGYMAIGVRAAPRWCWSIQGTSYSAKRRVAEGADG